MTSPYPTRSRAYRFLPGETIAEGFSRILEGQIRKARKQMAAPADPAKAVHETRKGLKRIRALLALARPALGDKTFRQENARYRDIARLLSSSRDEVVLRDSITTLRQRLLNDELSERPVASPLDTVELDHRLASQADAGLAALFDNMEVAQSKPKEPELHEGRIPEAEVAIADAYEAIKRAARVTGQSIGEAGGTGSPAVKLADIASGYRSGYALGRREMRAAFASPDDELFHEWRKAVQLHWRQSMLLSTPWPSLMRARGELARELSQIVGQDHDLAVLARHAASQPAKLLSQKRKDAVMQTIERCQAHLRDEARKIGAVLYAQKPSELESHLQCMWTAACDGGGRLIAPHPAITKAEAAS